MQPSDCQRSRRGFTFVELLAAMVFMAILLPAMMQGITLSNRVGVAAERRRVATQLVEQILTEVVASEEWDQGNLGSDFGPDFVGYRYETTVESWSLTDLRLVTARVFYTVQQQEYSVELSTVVDASEDSVTVTSGTSGA